MLPRTSYTLESCGKLMNTSATWMSPLSPEILIQAVYVVKIPR
jgi:hypothetical protein